MVEMIHVDGKDKGSIKLFALTTCVWCKKTKKLLDSLDVAYDYVYVDTLQGSDRDQVMDEMKQWNPRRSFPTIVFGNQTSIAGFKEDQIKEILKQ
jgi:glutaredoxin